MDKRIHKTITIIGAIILLPIIWFILYFLTIGIVCTIPHESSVTFSKLVGYCSDMTSPGLISGLIPTLISIYLLYKIVKYDFNKIERG